MKSFSSTATLRRVLLVALMVIVLAQGIHSALFAGVNGSSNEWVNFYSTNSVYYGGPLPVGVVVRAMDPTGTECGEFTVANGGQFGLMPCYRDDGTTTTDEGAVPGDRISFKINDTPATAIPLRLNNTPVPPSTNITWNQHGDLWEVQLVAADTPNAGLTISNKARTDPLCVNWFQHYDITVTNSNNALTLTGVVISDVLPLKTYLLPALTSPGYSYDAGTRTMVWTIGTLSPGEQRSVYLEVGTNSTLAEGEAVQNEAQGDSDETTRVSAVAANVMTRQSPPCNPSPTATATATSTPSVTATPTATATAMPSATPTAAASPTQTPINLWQLFLPVIRR